MSSAKTAGHDLMREVGIKSSEQVLGFIDTMILKTSAAVMDEIELKLEPV